MSTSVYGLSEQIFRSDTDAKDTSQIVNSVFTGRVIAYIYPCSTSLTPTAIQLRKLFGPITIYFPTTHSTTHNGASTGNMPPQPSVTTVDASHFQAPSDLKATNISGPDVLTGDRTKYPVVQWAGFTYYPLSYIDNRVAYAIATTITYDNELIIIKIFEAQGSRYIWEINIDQDNQKVNFVGQSSNVASVSFFDLGIIV